MCSPRARSASCSRSSRSRCSSPGGRSSSRSPRCWRWRQGRWRWPSCRRSSAGRATAQATLRWAFVLLLVLLVGALQFGLDVVLGALLAGIVLRTWTRQMDFDVQPLEDKLEAVGYGVFIPVFFVASGMSLDVVAVLRDPVRLLIFAGLLLAVRGLPSLVIYRHALT